MKSKRNRKTKITVLPDEYDPVIIAKLDGRCEFTKQIRRGIREIMDSLGGESEVAPPKRGLIERFVFQELLLERMEEQLAVALLKGREYGELHGRYTQGCNAYSGLASKIGLERKARKVTLRNVVEAHDR